jgi:hypothetical protein
VNVRQASVLRKRLSGRFPGSAIDVTPDDDGARIFIEHQDGFHVRVTTGDQPGVVLLAMLGRDFRAINSEGTEGTS